MRYIILAFFITLTFVACGGGGGGGGGSSSNTVVTSANKTVMLSDEYSKYQWYIKDTGAVVDRFGTTSVGGNDLDLQTVYTNYLGYNSGNPILVQVVDTGVDADHEDLAANMNLTSSYNASNSSTNPTPTTINSTTYHGTSVAGIIGAVGYNNVGLKGVAPSSNIAGFAFRISGTSLVYSLSELQRAWLSGTNANNIIISNNSWGSCIDKSVDEEAILQSGTSTLRDGKGRIYVFSGGNGRGGDTDCPNTSNDASSNTTYLTNSQYSIAVGAITNNNTYASYSSPGSNLLVSAYSGDTGLPKVGTTVPAGYSGVTTWTEDTDRNYTSHFSGTSASAPMVSGALALVLEACPNLTYRDVKYLIAKNAIQVDSSNSSWVTNAAGLKHSNDYGFGLINTKAMINECTTTYTNLAAKQTKTSSSSPSVAITTTALNQVLNIVDSITVEWVGLTVTSNYNLAEALEIKLISPSGTESILLHSNNQTGTNTFLSTGFRLSSQAFMQENSQGNWQVEIKSNNASGSGSLTGLRLEVVGH